jgi:uncharacterized membrane protein YfcA
VTPDAHPASAGHPVRRILALLLTGALGGFLSGAFGVGGGIIMVPLLLWLIRLDQRRAAATSLAAIVPTAIAGSTAYLAAGHIDVIAGLLVAAGGIGGSLIGTRLLRTLPLGWLRWGFIVLLVLVAVRMFFEVPTRGAEIAMGPSTIAGLVLLGLVMGIAAGLFGVGGGIIAVPVLIAVFGASDLIAKGTSLLAMIPTSITGTAANLRSGLVRPLDGVALGVAATGASFGGAAVAFAIPASASGILFGVFVLVVALQLTIRAIRLRRRG